MVSHIFYTISINDKHPLVNYMRHFFEKNFSATDFKLVFPTMWYNMEI